MMTARVEPLIFSKPDTFSLPQIKIEGTLPDYVEGTYYLNGPGMFQRGGMTFNHWLDGDALLRQLRFDQGNVSYQSSYLGSRRRLCEEAEGKPLFRNFGTAFHGDKLNRSGIGLEANINVSVYPYKDRLLAFGEQALPLEVDPENLETLGEYDFDGVLNELSPFSGHPKYDPHTGHMCNFGVQFLGRRARLYYYEMGSNLQLLVSGYTSLPIAANMHDFAVSEHYACFYLSPYVLDVRQVCKRGGTLLDSLQWQADQPSSMIIMERATGKLVARLPMEHTQYCLHLINSFERQGQLVVDLLLTDRPFFDQYLQEPGMFSDITPCKTCRIEINTQTWERSHLVELIHGIHLDFPTIHRGKLSRDYAHYWALGMPIDPGPKFYNQLLHFNWHTQTIADRYETSAGEVLSGEPAHVAHPKDPDKAAIIVQTHNLEKQSSQYLVFNAFDLAGGPVARLPLNRFDPMGFHSVFQPKTGFVAN